MVTTQARTAVIVPFYQRKAGLLLQAVESVFAQGVEDTLVIVVDDGSPRPAREEVGALARRDPRLLLLEQANAGPSTARNRGLDAVPLGTPYVAFLDSDDRWLPGHLSRALLALEKGADFYFADADYRERGEKATYFTQLGFSPSTNSPIGGGEDVFFYEADLFDAILLGGPMVTSSLIFRRSIAPELRFPTTVRFREDTYFWLQLVLRARRIAFSLRCDSAFGRGVNIAASAVWGTAGSLKNLVDGKRVDRMIAANMTLTKEQYARLFHDLGRRRRREFAGTLLHLLRRGDAVDWSVVRAYARLDPLLVGEVLVVAVRRALRRGASAGA